MPSSRRSSGRSSSGPSSSGHDDVIEVVGNIDEVIAQMEREDELDATKLSPREYGLSHGIKPQLVYYYIRKGHLTLETCICGRHVIDVAAADEFFKAKEGTTDEDV